MAGRRKSEVSGFVDESLRGQRYLMSCVLIEARHQSSIRSIMRRLAGNRRRIHFNQESNKTRLLVLRTISQLDIKSFVVETQLNHGINVKESRSLCLKAIVRIIQRNNSAERLIIESISDTSSDIRDIQSVRLATPNLVFEHRHAIETPELWISDAIVWAAGMGGPWREEIETIQDFTHVILE